MRPLHHVIAFDRIANGACPWSCTSILWIETRPCCSPGAGQPLQNLSAMSESQLQSCTMCSYCTTNPRQLLNHVFTIHRHDPNFHVYCSHCMRSYKKLSAYRKHISRGCTEPVVEDITAEQRSLCPSSSELPEGDTYTTL